MKAIVVPGHGYVSDEHEVVEYGDILVIIRDRVQAMLRKGATPIASRSADVLTMADTTPVVFIVDDDISVRDSLELLLRSDGWRCESFASA